MTEHTNKPALRSPLTIDWAEDVDFEIRLEVRPDLGSSPFTPPPALSSHDTAFFTPPPQFWPR